MRRRDASVLGAFLFLTASAAAAEEYARGMAVAREVETKGSRFVITVRPPADRGVDPRVFDAIEIMPTTDAAARSRAAAELLPRHAPKSRANDVEEDAAVDVSGYTIKFESLAAASCVSQFTAKLKKVSLGGKQSLFVSGSGAQSVLVAAYPTKGDVDSYVYNGNDFCDASEQPAGQLDVAFCGNTACGGQNFTGEIYNPFSSQASYVGIVHISRVN